MFFTTWLELELMCTFSRTFAKDILYFFSEENVLHFSYISTQFIDNVQQVIHITRLWSNWSLV